MNGSIVSQAVPKNQAPQISPLPLGEGHRVGDWPWQFGGQRRGKAGQSVDPFRRLVAAVACQAIIDLVDPPYHPKMQQRDAHYAFIFLCQHRQIIRDLGIPYHKLDFLAEWLEEREEVQP